MGSGLLVGVGYAGMGYDLFVGLGMHGSRKESFAISRGSTSWIGLGRGWFMGKRVYIFCIGG